MRLEIDDVEFKVRSKCILNGINTILDPGVTCLLGPNGAGKTSLLRILATVLPPSGGQVRLIHEQGGERVQRSRLGYVPQTFSYYSNFTITQLLEYVGSLKKIPRHHLSNAVEHALHVTNLVEYANQRLGTLSGGTLQRAAIAQAMVNDPVLLILDEPTVGLDPSQRHAFMRLIDSVAATRIILLSTHLVEDVVAAATKHVLILTGGQIIFDGPAHQLTGQPPSEELSMERVAEGYEHWLETTYPHGS